MCPVGDAPSNGCGDEPDRSSSAENDPDLHRSAKALRSEFVIAARGKVRVRGQGLANPNLKTGEIEVVASQL